MEAQKDCLVRAISKDGFVNAVAVYTRGLTERARQIHHTSPVATAALGRALAACSMMGNALKDNGASVTMQIKGDGPLGTILTVSDSEGNVRGYVQNPAVDLALREDGKLDVGTAVGHSGTLTVIKDLNLKEPYVGSVELLGHPMNETNRIPLLRQTGSLIESPSGYLHLTARENLAIVADLKGVAHKDIDRVLEIVHLTADANRKVGQYSLGMKQRLGIAMALLGSPKLLILDEPTNGLDPAGIQEMRSLISSMPETTGATVLISSHLLGEIEQMVTQVGILNHGKMLFEGSLQALQKHSRGGILLRVLDVPKSIAVLNRQGIRAVTQAQHPDVLELPALPDEALAALVSTLAENGVGVVGLTAQTKNLEEIFLSLTQNNGEVA